MFLKNRADENPFLLIYCNGIALDTSMEPLFLFINNFLELIIIVLKVSNPYTLVPKNQEFLFYTNHKNVKRKKYIELLICNAKRLSISHS